VTQLEAKVLREARVDPPFHTAYLRSAAATTRISAPEGASEMS